MISHEMLTLSYLKLIDEIQRNILEFWDRKEGREERERWGEGEVRGRERREIPGTLVQHQVSALTS